MKKILLYINIMIVVGLWITGFAGYLDPNTWSWLSLAGYAFPFLLFATGFSLIFWAFAGKKYLAVPVVGLLVAYAPVSLYFPVHFGSDEVEEERKITMMSYNTMNWGRDYGELNKELHPNPIIEYIKEKDADIVCLQEAAFDGGISGELDSTLYKQYEYHDTACMKDACVTIFSKYRIIRKQAISHNSAGAICGIFWLNVNGKEVMVVNNHLQTMGFSMNDREDFGRMMHGEEHEKDFVKSTSRVISTKILKASKKRAKQAETLAAFLRANNDLPTIVCGDFNDLPLSYTYHTIAAPGKSIRGERVDLTDCYRATGLGPGFSYSKFAMRARIDNILCSTAHFTPHNCFVDKSTGNSDHYPIITELTFK